MHFAAFGYQSGELFQRLNPFFQGTENFVVHRGNGVDRINTYEAQLDVYKRQPEHDAFAQQEWMGL